ncbi:MAG: enoyl-CoA hydratase-related protein [Chloroflexota bacterium]|nr:enoyl-CoA hydratase-related protein [Chloroflexota bacterium]
MPYHNIVYEKKNHIGYITLNRPDGGNSIDGAMANDLEKVVRGINDDEDVRVVIITGSGNIFSTGRQEPAPEDILAASAASSAIAELKLPVIASVNGDAIGAGLEVALACDIRLAVSGARLGLTQVSNGFIPSGGGTQRLPRIVGRGKALELILTANVFDAEEAYRIGLVNSILPVAALNTEVENLARKLAAKGPISAMYAKEAINKGMDMSLSQGLRLEADLSFLLHTTNDRAEGISAFLGKRTPEFRGE